MTSKLKNHEKKLTLNRETLRALDEAQLGQAAGGTGCSMQQNCTYRSAAVNCRKETICPG